MTGEQGSITTTRSALAGEFQNGEDEMVAEARRVVSAAEAEMTMVRSQGGGLVRFDGWLSKEGLVLIAPSTGEDDLVKGSVHMGATALPSLLYLLRSDPKVGSEGAAVPVPDGPRTPQAWVDWTIEQSPPDGAMTLIGFRRGDGTTRHLARLHAGTDCWGAASDGEAFPLTEGSWARYLATLFDELPEDWLKVPAALTS